MSVYSLLSGSTYLLLAIALALNIARIKEQSNFCVLEQLFQASLLIRVKNKSCLHRM